MLEHMVVTVMESFQDRNLAKLYILKLHILYNSNLNLPQGKTNLPRSNTKTSWFLDWRWGISIKYKYDEVTFWSKFKLILMKKEIFNYRLSRIRIIENAFGILHIGVFKKSIAMHSKSVDKIVLAIIFLHNFLDCQRFNGNE